VGTERSPAIRLYRRESPRFDALREMLMRHDFHAVVPPDAIAEWEVVDDRGTRVRAWMGAVLVEAREEAEANEFDARFRAALPSDREIPDGGAPPERVAVIAGSDEAGKGERDRALAVAAVVVPVEAEAEAIARGVRDSKLCAAGEVADLARWLARHFRNEVRVVAAAERELALREAGGNETRLLTRLHADCLRDLHVGSPFALARVDRFAPRRPVAAAFPEAIVDECVRGERHVACAAASILARSAS
jgi:ribonuclease HIII